MKRLHSYITRSILLIALISLIPGCDYREKEQELKKREQSLNEREQQLILREKSLEIEKNELSRKKLSIDSLQKIDTSRIVDQRLVGTWDVVMTCTETTCPGSAVGDVKNETWEISYNGSALLAKASANNQLVRVYSGFYTGNTVELLEDQNSTVNPSGARMVVRLHLADESRLEGQREITRENNCKILYAMRLQRTNK